MKIALCFLVCAVSCVLAVKIEIEDDLTPHSFKDEVWTWKCGEKGCTKERLAPGERPVNAEVCRLVCPVSGVLWPKPTTQKVSNRLYRLDPYGAFIANSENIGGGSDATKMIQDAFERFNEGMRQLDQDSNASGQGLGVHILARHPEQFRYVQGANESYTLIVTPGQDGRVNATITCETLLGGRHGLETLGQLIVRDPFTGSILIPSEVEVTDGPAYTHRGITLDTARNFISVASIKRTLEAMAATKLNTFHWHITDSHSFPFESKSFPNLTKYGAYSKDKVAGLHWELIPQETGADVTPHQWLNPTKNLHTRTRLIYTEKDIKDIVNYAEIRGIRVVPEFDAPAHVGEGWQWANDSVVCLGAEPWQTYCVEPPCGQLDPTHELTYSILTGIYSDMGRLFHSDHFHMGGDEVNLQCWKSVDRIVHNMENMGLKADSEGFHSLWAKFQDKARKIVAKEVGESVKPLLWTSTLTEGKHLTDYLNSSDYIIQIWTKKNDEAIAHLVNNGFQVILSNYDALYFDCGFGAWVGAGNNWCSPYIPWQTVYQNDPRKLLAELGVKEDLHHLALGAEAALWTEQADDSSIDNRFWPRASALGEALWSGPGLWQGAEHRLLYHRQKLVERGIQADTMQPQWCFQNQGACYL